MVTYHYQSIPYFADQWNKPDDPSNNAENLKTRHGEVGKRAGSAWWSGSKLRVRYVRRWRHEAATPRIG